jgi:hypothetical protein
MEASFGCFPPGGIFSGSLTEDEAFAPGCHFRQKKPNNPHKPPWKRGLANFRSYCENGRRLRKSTVSDSNVLGGI